MTREESTSTDNLDKLGSLLDQNIITLMHFVRILSRANESKIEINGKISKALIDSGTMILMMSKGYCDEQVYEIQPLDQLVPIDDSGGADVAFLGYVEVRMQILGISSFD